MTPQPSSRPSPDRAADKDRTVTPDDGLEVQPCPHGRIDYEACFAPFRYCPEKGCGRTDDRHDFDPGWVMPTSVFLQEWLDDKGLSAGEAVHERYATGYRNGPLQVLLRVLNDQPLTVADTEVLAEVTGVNASFWHALERYYRVGVASGKTVVR